MDNANKGAPEPPTIAVVKEEEIDDDNNDSSDPEAKRIIDILEKQVHQAEIGYVVKIDDIEILSREAVCNMKGEYVYGVLSVVED